MHIYIYIYTHAYISIVFDVETNPMCCLGSFERKENRERDGEKKGERE